ncbi:S24 family peptidase [Corticibacterium sp. UT-5YL-CI-8]|nr:S24 family peptidase [Tianweitania sp. UT-5YL-CI-8]
MSKAADIVRALKKKGVTQIRIASELGVSQPSVNDWVNKGAVPSSENMDLLRQLAKREGIQVDDGFTIVRSDSDSAPVREVDAKLGAGGGGIPSIHNDDAFRAAEWSMPIAFLRSELKITPSKALVAEIVGNSGYDPERPNAPGSLHPGDRVIIDTDDKQPSPPGHFAVYDGLGFVIKQVDVVRDTDPLRLRLTSQNPAYAPYEVSEDEGFFIVGRVKGRISRM